MSSMCEREDELLDALGAGYVGAELESHVISCASCSELRSVAGALLDDRAMAMMEAPVPSSGTMWWRMRLRQRHEAAATAQRTLLIGQAVTLAVAITLLVSFFGSEVAVGVREAVATMRVSTPVLLAIATSLLAAPIAGWVAVRQK